MNVAGSRATWSDSRVQSVSRAWGVGDRAPDRVTLGKSQIKRVAGRYAMGEVRHCQLFASVTGLARNVRRLDSVPFVVTDCELDGSGRGGLPNYLDKVEVVAPGSYDSSSGGDGSPS